MTADMHPHVVIWKKQGADKCTASSHPIVPMNFTAREEQQVAKVEREMKRGEMKLRTCLTAGRKKRSGVGDADAAACPG